MPVRVCVVGFKNTGKTKFLASIIPLLSSEGLRIAVVKHSHQRADLPAKDTARLLASQPVAVAYSSPHDNILMLNPAFNLDYFLELLNLDVVFYEGFKRSPYPKILTAVESRNLDIGVDPALVRMVVAPENLRDEALKLYPKAVFSSPNDEKLLEKVLQVLRQIYVSKLPGLNCGLCGYSSCNRYAESILKGEARIGRCIHEDPPASLYVDWSKVELKGYPARVLKALLTAFTDTLKGVKEDRTFIVASTRIRREESKLTV